MRRCPQGRRPSGYQGGRSVKEVNGGARRSGRALGILIGIVAASAAAALGPATAVAAPAAAIVDSAKVGRDSLLGASFDSLFGLSGMLRAKLISDLRILEVGAIGRLF